jgi:hypothetical protein
MRSNKTTVMEYMYLVGRGFPTHDQFQGCRINAGGYYASISTCTVIQVRNSTIACPSISSLSTP